MCVGLDGEPADPSLCGEAMPNSDEDCNIEDCEEASGESSSEYPDTSESKGTVGKIYTPIFSFYRKRVVNITILELGPVPNESPGNCTYYRGIL